MIKIYQVGGSVRDEIMGIPPSDLDYVVVGAKPEDLLKRGFTQVGSDFPVFLHPETKDEYALARTERKTGNGYSGFTTTFDPSVTLEEDLKRRDLTINAIAKDSQGRIIDPFGGINDINNKTLKHVSDAFGEDPLRILRVARFAARFNFSIHPETMEIMKSIHNKGETLFLTKERIWKEYSRVLNHDHVRLFYKCLDDVGLGKNMFAGYHAYNHPDFYLTESFDSFLMNKNIKEKIIHNILPPKTSIYIKDDIIENLKNISAPKEIIDYISIISKMWIDIHNEELTENFYLNFMIKNDALRRRDRFIDAYASILKHSSYINSVINLPDLEKMKEWINSIDIDAQSIAKEGSKNTIAERILLARKDSFSSVYKEKSFKI